MLLTPHVKCYCSHDFRTDNNILSVGHTIMIAKIQQIQIFRLKVFEFYTSERESSFNEMKHEPDEKRYEQSGKKSQIKWDKKLTPKINLPESKLIIL